MSSQIRIGLDGHTHIPGKAPYPANAARALTFQRKRSVFFSFSDLISVSINGKFSSMNNKKNLSILLLVAFVLGIVFFWLFSSATKAALT